MKAIRSYIPTGLEDTAKASDSGSLNSKLKRGEPYSCATGIVAIKAERLMAAGANTARPYGEKSSRMQARAPNKVPRLSVLKVLPSSLPLLPADSSKCATILCFSMSPTTPADVMEGRVGLFDAKLGWKTYTRAAPAETAFSNEYL